MQLATDEKIVKVFNFNNIDLSITTDRLIIDEKNSKLYRNENASTSTNTFSSHQYSLNDISNISINNKTVTRTTPLPSGNAFGILIFFGLVLLVLGIILYTQIEGPIVLLAFLFGVALIICAMLVKSKGPKTQTNHDTITELNIFIYKSTSPIFTTKIFKSETPMLESIFPIILDIRKDKDDAVKKWAGSY